MKPSFAARVLPARHRLSRPKRGPRMFMRLASASAPTRPWRVRNQAVTLEKYMHPREGAPRKGTPET